MSITLRVVDTADESALRAWWEVSQRRVLADFPDCGRATTCNADTNDAMNLVNERMGYLPTERLLELQKVLRPS